MPKRRRRISDPDHPDALFDPSDSGDLDLRAIGRQHETDIEEARAEELAARDALFDCTEEERRAYDRELELRDAERQAEIGVQARKDREQAIRKEVHAIHFGQVHCVSCANVIDVSGHEISVRIQIRRCSSCLSGARPTQGARYCRHCGQPMAPLADPKAQASRAVCDPCKPKVLQCQEAVQEEVRRRMSLEFS